MTSPFSSIFSASYVSQAFSGQSPGGNNSNRHRAGASQKWHLVWCHEWIHKPEYRKERAVVTEAARACGATVHCLKKASVFASWLTKSESAEPYVLLASWRLTKPCADILVQQELERRPALAIIDCEHPSHLTAAPEWVAHTGRTVAQFLVTDHLHRENVSSLREFFGGTCNELLRGIHATGKYRDAEQHMQDDKKPSDLCSAYDDLASTAADDQSCPPSPVASECMPYEAELSVPSVDLSAHPMQPMIFMAVIDARTELAGHQRSPAEALERLLLQAMPDHYED